MKKSKALQHPDRKLIFHCMAFIINKAGFEAALQADPSSNFDFTGSHASGLALADNAFTALEAATKLKATTPDGLRAKAAVIPHMQDEPDYLGEATEVRFIIGLAADVRAYFDRKEIEETDKRRAAMGLPK